MICNDDTNRKIIYIYVHTSFRWWPCFWHVLDGVVGDRYLPTSCLSFWISWNLMRMRRWLETTQTAWPCCRWLEMLPLRLQHITTMNIHYFKDFHWNRWIIFQENGDILDFQSEVTTIWRSDFTDFSLKLTSFWEVLYPWCYRKIDRKIGFRWMRFSEGRWSISRSSHDP